MRPSQFHPLSIQPKSSCVVAAEFIFACYFLHFLPSTIFMMFGWTHYNHVSTWKICKLIPSAFILVSFWMILQRPLECVLTECNECCLFWSIDRHFVLRSVYAVRTTHTHTHAFILCLYIWIHGAVRRSGLTRSCDLVADQPMIALIKKFAIFTMYFCTCSCWLLTSSLFLLLFIYSFFLFYDKCHATSLSASFFNLFAMIAGPVSYSVCVCVYFLWHDTWPRCVTIQANNSNSLTKYKQKWQQQKLQTEWINQEWKLAECASVNIDSIIERACDTWCLEISD